MVTTELGACEWFVWDLRRSNLIDRGQLDQVIGEYLARHPGVEPPALAEHLIGKGILTSFQADRLLQGKTQGFVLGPFTLMDALGTGSMGTVYKAISKTDNRCYAVKVLPRRSMWNVRLARRKVRAFEACKHPAVVPFQDVGTSGGMHYLAWPLVEGETLESIVLKREKLPVAEAAGFVMQAAEGLAICHEQALFHGLLKASNLMLGPDGQLRILDFGIGCLLSETEGESLVDTMSTANSVASGLDCASPESIMDPSNLTPAGDQYSLGCVLYFCLAGRYPFPDGTAVEKMMSHQFKEPTPLQELVPEVPDGLVAVINRLTRKTPQERYPSMHDVISALRPYVETSLPRPKSRPVLRSDGGHESRKADTPVVPQATVETPRPISRKPDTAANPPRRKPDSVPVVPNRPVLPNRQSLKSAPRIVPVTVPAGQADPQKAPSRQLKPARTVEEKVGPVGVTVGAILVCILAWWLTLKLF
jgi:serine/threonine-protein kinase